MSKLTIPSGYIPALNVYDTQTAIGFIKHVFEDRLINSMKLKRVSAPLFVQENTGMNDDLNGVERPVAFEVPALASKAEVVHSLAKWKRLALYRYDFHVGNGIYTDMNAIRRDEELDNTHSIYVDQWDWERVIDSNLRTIPYLKEVVNTLVNAICETSNALKEKYPNVSVSLDPAVSFITSQELEDLYPDLSPEDREHAYVRNHPTTFILQIGDTLKSGVKHGSRAPDYDDWSLNGDLLFWHEPLQRALEISSMGIRVDRESLLSQLQKSDNEHRLKYMFHQMVVDGILPLTIGGGIGQSRLCMLLLGNVHIGEVQVSIWDDLTYEVCKGKVNLL